MNANIKIDTIVVTVKDGTGAAMSIYANDINGNNQCSFVNVNLDAASEYYCGYKIFVVYV
jgi:hypothetical protein